MKKAELIKFYSIHRAKIFPAVVALASLILIIFVIYPQTVKLTDNQKVLGNLKRRSELLETKVTKLQSYDKNDLSDKLEITLSTLPQERDFGDILGLLQQLTIKFGFITNTVSFSGNPEQPANVSKFGVRLNVKGSKTMYLTLLDNLENSHRLMRINSVELSSKEGVQVFDSALVLDALYAQLPKDYGGIDSSLPELSQKDEELIVKLDGLRQTALVSSTFSAIESPRGKSNPFE